jgi:hypothetical protein
MNTLKETMPTEVTVIRKATLRERSFRICY